MASNVKSGNVGVQTYGDDAAQVLSSYTKHINVLIPIIVDRFYQLMASQPNSKRLLDLFKQDDIDNLYKNQRAYLTAILHPALSRQAHRAKAIADGCAHCNVGMSLEMMSEATSAYTDIVTNYLPETSVQAHKLCKIVIQRLLSDLVMHNEAYSLTLQNRSEIYERISNDKKPYKHDISYKLDTLRSLMDVIGNTGAAIGRMHDGLYQHELSYGQVLFDCKYSQNNAYPKIDSHALRHAWLQEQAIIENAVEQSTWLSEASKITGARTGIRSLCVSIIKDDRGAPDQMLMVFTRLPGYFLNEEIEHYWQRLADKIGLQLTSLTARCHSNNITLADTAIYYRQLLAQGNVRLLYQPIINPRNLCTEKAEVLTRLYDNNAEYSPAQFLPAFGRNQLRELFEISLSAALDQTSGASLDALKLTLNLPTAIIQDARWFTALPELIKSVGGSAQRIGFEILESALNDNVAIQSGLYHLQAAGFDIYLDDVGSGESSLMRVATLPITGIKIDQNFVRPLGHDFSRLDLIILFMTLAEQRGLDCIAEGVENASIADALASIGNMKLQGYAFSKPLCIDELSLWLSSQAIQAPTLYPQSLYGWYSRHLLRQMTLRHALLATPDLIDPSLLQNYNNCPLHHLAQHLAFSNEVDHAHREWHAEVAGIIKAHSIDGYSNVLMRKFDIAEAQLRKVIMKHLHNTPSVNNVVYMQPQRVTAAL